MIFEQQPEIIYAVYMAFILANLLMIPFLAGSPSNAVPRCSGCRENMLMPGILTFCIVGSFAINNTVFDVGIMLIMGIAGYFLRANGSPVAPVVLGLVLGPSR